MTVVSIAHRIGAGFGRLRRAFTRSSKPDAHRATELARLKIRIAELNRKTAEMIARIDEKLHASGEFAGSCGQPSEAALDSFDPKLQAAATDVASIAEEETKERRG